MRQYYCSYKENDHNKGIAVFKLINKHRVMRLSTTKLINLIFMPYHIGSFRLNINKLILALFLSVFAPTALLAIIPGIWAVNDGEKVKKYDLNNPNKASNSAWDGTKIKIFGGCNEIIAFQVIVEGGVSGYTVGANLPSLTRRNGGGIISYTAPAWDPTIYVGRPISIFTENYMNITKGTNCGWIFHPGTPAAPKDPLGWTPVQLVPENAAAGKGGLPILVAANSNQGLWFDIYTAKGLAAGIYDGTVTITRDGTPTAIPIELELFNFTLPDENSIKNMIPYNYGAFPSYHAGDLNGLDNSYNRLAHRYKIDLCEGNDEKRVNSRIRFFNGSAFTSKSNYDGPGVGVGNKIVARSWYPDINSKPPMPGFDTQAEAWKSSDAWMTFMNNTFPQKGWITFLYMPDEPWWNQGVEKRAYINRVGGYIHNNPGIGNTLSCLTTSHYDASIEGGTDIWDTNMDGFKSNQAAIERSHGDDMWVYNGYRPFGGAGAAYDSPATDQRVNMWACFKKGVKVYYYYWFNGWDAGNPWVITETYPASNGDGCVVYPGECRNDASQNRNIGGPIAGLVLANMRRGSQDVEYLTMASQLGLTSTVNTVLKNIVPKIFDEVKNPDTEPCYFPQNGNAYETARYTLAQAIANYTPAPITYLSDLIWSSAINGWGPVENDKSNGEINPGDGKKITLNGTTYTKGLGCNAATEIKYSLGGLYQTFVSDIGVDDEMGAAGSVIFQVWADGVKIYDSGLMTATDTTKTVRVNISGIKELKLIITEGGDGIVGDHGDWANAQLLTLTTALDVPVLSRTPKSVALSQNVPNPVRNETIIGFNIPESVVNAEISIYNLQGMKIRAYKIAERGFGSLNVLCSGLDPAIYFYVLLCDNTIVTTKKMIIT